jgi:DNA-binding MarR family transcriptional regulator
MNASQLAFVECMGKFYSQQYGLAPVVGRVLGYLSVCLPVKQSIANLADTLHAGRTTITDAVRLLERYHLVRRERPAGMRIDLVSFDVAGLEKNGLDIAAYEQQAALAREGLTLLGDTPSEQRQALEEIILFAEFLSEHVPKLLQEWHEYKKNKGGKIS